MYGEFDEIYKGLKRLKKADYIPEFSDEDIVLCEFALNNFKSIVVVLIKKMIRVVKIEKYNSEFILIESFS